MQVRNYSVTIPEGVENNSGHVEIEHNKQYSITLENSTNSRCDAEISIDGKVVGTWRLEAWQIASLERGTEDKGRFTCYHSDSNEATKAGLKSVSKDKLGLIQVKFTPELYVPPVNTTKSRWAKNNFMPSSGPCGQSICCHNDGLESYTSAGTGLSGKSKQEFGVADAIIHDINNQVTINLRLVGQTNEPRPLVAVGGKSNPIPRPV